MFWEQRSPIITSRPSPDQEPIPIPIPISIPIRPGFLPPSPLPAAEPGTRIPAASDSGAPGTKLHPQGTIITA